MHLITFLLPYLLINHVKTSRILFVSPTSAYSHLLFARTIYKELANRGHEVVAFVPFKIRDEKVQNLTEVSWSVKKTSRTFNQILKSHRAVIYHRLLQTLMVTCDGVYTNKDMRKLLDDPKQHFDLIVIEWNVIACFSVLKEHFKAPLIGIRSLYLRLEGHDYIGNPTNPSYIPMGYFGHSPDFRGKLSDFMFSVFWRLHHYLYTLPRVQKKVDKYFPAVNKSCLQMEKDVDLVLTNTNYVLNGVRPLVPASVDVGMIHIGQENFSLSTDTKEFLDASHNGFILFNVGTTLNSEALTDEAKHILSESLGKLPYNVVMKFDGFRKVPRNVKVWDWFPQESVLAHPNIKCFISHGGLLSIQEAAYYKVPLVVVPFIFDQPLNAYHIEKLGIGRKLEIDDLSNQEKFIQTVTDVCENKRYKDNVIRISKILQDQPMKPLDKAIWWIEYVIRNKGMPHGRSEAVHMNIFTYLLLDVLLFLLLCVYVIYKIMSIISKYYHAKRINAKLKLL